MGDNVKGYWQLSLSFCSADHNCLRLLLADNIIVCLYVVTYTPNSNFIRSSSDPHSITKFLNNKLTHPSQKILLSKTILSNYNLLPQLLAQQ